MRRTGAPVHGEHAGGSSRRASSRFWGGRRAGYAAGTAALATAERVAGLVPPDAVYVTASAVMPLDDAQHFQGGAPGDHGYGDDLDYIPVHHGVRQERALLVLARGRLLVISADGERWSRRVAALTDLDGHRRSGFVLIAADGSGIAAATPTPVQVPAGARFRTVPPVSSAFGGWNAVLAEHGVRVHW